MIILLGSTGFIGKSLLNFLQEQQIKCLGISSKEIDLTEKSAVNKLVKLLKPNSVLIFASSIVREKGDDLENMQKNIDMAKNVAQAIKIKPIKKMVFISSIDVYGKPNGIVSEKTPLNPTSPYGISKLVSESILGLTCESLRIPCLILRLGGIFGPGQSPKKYGPNSFIDSALKKREVFIYGDGKEIRDLIFVGDLVKIISHFSTNNTKGIINIATGKALSFSNIIELLQDLLPGKIIIKHGPRTGAKLDLKFNVSNLKRYLPKDFIFTSLKKALKITVDSTN